MRNTPLLLCLPLAAFAQSVVVFENVEVVPMDRERVVSRQTVVVRDGRIAEVGPSGRVKTPPDARRVDGRGKYLMPGFAEMHGHLPGPTAPPEAVESQLFLFVSNGVTTVRGMQGGPHNLEMRARVASGALLGPTLYVAGPAFSGQSAGSVEVATRMVREQKAAGYDLLKIQEGLTRGVYDSIVGAARQAGIRFGGHIPNDVALDGALKARQSSIDHLDNYYEALGPEVDESKIPALAAETKKAGVWVVPTMALWEVFNGETTGEALAARADVQYMPRATVEQWVKAVNGRREKPLDVKERKRVLDVRRKVLRALRDAGVGIIFGTDAPQLFSVPGFSIHREMQIMVASGLKPYEVMAAGTRNPAVYFDAEKEFGTVAAGKRADLVLLDANPLADVANFGRRAGVMVRGRWLPEAEIQKRLAQIAAGAKS